MSFIGKIFKASITGNIHEVKPIIKLTKKPNPIFHRRYSHERTRDEERNSL